jgi:hypothetical protein
MCLWIGGQREDDHLGPGGGAEEWCRGAPEVTLRVLQKWLESTAR